MAKDRERESKHNDRERDDGMEDIRDEEEIEAEDPDEPEFEQPFCPRCGWHNTRPSHTSNALDLVVRMFGLRPYRCRSCGNRFRSMRKARKA
jgi:hypothetical protein